MISKNFDTLKTWMKKLITSLSIQSTKKKTQRKRQADTSGRYSHMVGLSIVQFAQSPHIVLPMTTNMTKQEINSYINMIQPTGGEANIGRALNFVRSNILSKINLSKRGEKTRNIVVLISTDKSIDEAKDAAIRLKNDGALLIKLKIGQSNQRLISRSTGSLGTEFRFENFDQLEPKRHQIKSTICKASIRKRALRPRRFNTRSRYLKARRGPIGPKGDRGLPGLPGQQGIPGECCSNCREVFNSLLLEQNFVDNKKQHKKSNGKEDCVPVLTENQVIGIVKKYFDEILNEKLDAILKQKLDK